MLGNITERETTKTIYMETIYLISINSIASRIKGRAWRRWYNFKRTMARAITAGFIWRDAPSSASSFVINFNQVSHGSSVQTICG